MNNIDILISDLTLQLINIFTVPNVKEIILYGSVARGTATSESDIDIAVILDDYTDKMHDEMIEFVVDLELKYNKVISVLPIYNKQFNEWGNITPFFKKHQKRREGIMEIYILICQWVPKILLLLISSDDIIYLVARVASHMR